MTDNKSIVFLFLGQGSQYLGMGKNLFETNNVFKESLEKSDKIIQDQLGRSLIDELYFTEAKTFDDILITHPAIVAIEIAMYEVLKDMGIKANYVFGTSLGKFAAGAISNVWSKEMAIETAIEQAKSIVRKELSGGMITIINNHDTNMEKMYRHFNLFLASDNFKGHFTLSGSKENLDKFQLELTKEKIQYVRLPVGIPFHSPLILEGLKDFNYYMSKLTFQKPKTRFISNIENKEIEDCIPNNYFGEVVSQYTNYTKTVNYLEKKGTHFYIDLGPSGTSSTFVKYNLKPLSKSITFQIMTLFGGETARLEQLKEIVKL